MVHPTRSTPTVAPATLERLAVADLPAAVALHQRLLPHGFFVELGPGFLRTYYRLFVDGPSAHATVVRTGDVVVGALVGTLHHERHAAWTMRRLPRLALAAAAAMAGRPSLVGRFVRARLTRYTRILLRRLRRLRRGSPDLAPFPPEHIAVLSHVFVDPELQGDGLGRLLVDDFVASARAAGADRIELVTLDGEDGAGGFYVAHGWRPRGAPHMVDGRPFQTYTLEL